MEMKDFQCFAVHCSVSQCVAVSYSVVQCFEFFDGMMLCIAECCSVLHGLQCVIIYTRIYICLYVYINVYVYIYTYTSVSIFISISIVLYVYIYIYIYIYLYICIYIHIYKYICVYIYIYKYIYKTKLATSAVSLRKLPSRVLRVGTWADYFSAAATAAVTCFAPSSRSWDARYTVCCSVLQRVAVCCSVLQCVAVRCSALQCASWGDS